jgi:hypothetical protein
VAIASFFISLIIKRHSMDKSLASDYTLKGGRAPIAPANGFPEMMSGGNQLIQPINKTSPFGGSTRSTTQETLSGYQYPATKHAKKAPRTRVQARDGKGSDSGAEATESDAIVAYYIQPGGRIVPVDIQPDSSQPSSEASSIFREVHFNTQYYGAAGVVGEENNMHHHPSAAEVWHEQAQARLQSDSGGHEAAGGNLPPVWMHTGR